MKKIITKVLALIMAVTLMATPVLATVPATDDPPVVPEIVEVVEVGPDMLRHITITMPERDYMTLFVMGRPSAPIALRTVDGVSYANLQDVAYVLEATVEWDGEDAIRWIPGTGIISFIVFEGVGAFEEDGAIWAPEDFVWELSFLTSSRFPFGATIREDIPPAAPVVRTTDHGQMAIGFIETLNDEFYNRVPFSYRELEAALWIRNQLIEMGYDEDAVVLQSFSIDENFTGPFGFGGSLGMYEQFNVFDQDQRLGFDDAIEAMVEMTIQQENEWIALSAEQMGVSEEEMRAIFAENSGMFVDIYDKMLEASARESAPFRLNFAKLFGLFDLDVHFRPMSQNVVLTVPGQSERKIVVTAHYDSVMTPGASDNASGTALLLESAYRLRYVDNYFTIVYVFAGAEEIGLLGAHYYVNSLTPEERNNLILNINADVLFEGPYFFFGSGIFEDFWLADNEISLLVGQVAETLNAYYGTALINAQPLAQMPSDQLPFLWGGHTVVALVGLARLGAEGYEEFPTWMMYPGFGASVVHTEFDDFHFINETWPNKIGDAMWTFSLFLDYLLVAEFDYTGLPAIGTTAGGTIPQDADMTGHPLVGTWAWDDSPAWTFVFNPDGTGTRGLPGQMTEFTWYADDFTLLIAMAGSELVEEWQLMILEDMLVLDLHWRSLIYTRVV